MTTTKNIQTTVLLFLACTILYFAYLYTLEGDGKGCGMDVGPIYGQKINLDVNKIKIDTLLKIPDGQFGLVNGKFGIDTIPPILIKFDKNKKISWAVKLDSEESGIPYYEMLNVKLVDDKNGKKITFFNLSFGEPGVIYLTERFEFDYLCLKSL